MSLISVASLSDADAQLVTERENLKLKGRAFAKRQHEGRDQGGEHATG